MTMETFLSWLPMLLLIAVWVIFARKGMARQAKNVGDTLTIGEAQTTELRRIQETLERIASSLEAARRA